MSGNKSDLFHSLCFTAVSVVLIQETGMR